MMFDYFYGLARGIQEKIDQEPDRIHARKKFALAAANLGKQLYSKEENIAWCGVTAPFDLLNAMGVTSCFVEFVGAMLANNGAAKPFISQAEDAGYAADSCAYHRAVTGAVLSRMMPEPDFIIGTSSPCTAGLAVVENMARIYKVDFFVLNVPQNNSPGAVQYLAGQLKEMTDFVSAHTGVPLSRERLADCLALTNETSDLLKEIFSLAMQKPSPVDNRFLRDFGTVMALFFGTKTGVSVCRAFRDELRHRIDSGSIDASKERLRLMWIQNRIQYRYPVEAIFENLGARIVIDELNHVTWDSMDPEEPFESLARRIITNPYSMDTAGRIAHIRKLAREYRIDGAINPCHWGCRQGTGTRGLITQGLKAINLPVLNLEIDCVDERNLAKGQIETRIEAFTEMLEEKAA